MSKPRSADAKSVQSVIVTASLRIAAARGWTFVTPQAVAKAAKLSSTVVEKHFVTLADLVGVIANEIDLLALRAVGKVSGTPHDRLFDLLMARFDILQRDRKAFLALYEIVRKDSRVRFAAARAALKTPYWFINAATIESPPRPFLALGLAGISGWSFLAWTKDTSKDMAKTMAAVDRSLRLADKTLTVVKKLFSSRDPGGAAK